MTWMSNYEYMHSVESRVCGLSHEHEAEVQRALRTLGLPYQYEMRYAWYDCKQTGVVGI